MFTVGPCFKHVLCRFSTINTKVWDKGTLSLSQITPPSPLQAPSITWHEKWTYCALPKALANISGSMFCSLGELRNEKCDWNLRYFLELAQMCLKTQEKENKNCWSIVTRLQKTPLPQLNSSTVTIIYIKMVEKVLGNTVSSYCYCHRGTTRRQTHLQFLD